ncbi:MULTISPECIES: hypothetical protein [Bradyrhizobium]|uniref:NPH3 domain-containing protein n=1 Tax=Bradyrhizobium septentrionale TaxID=1404411 RepID=A0ABZ2PBF8_9BRAD
MLTELNEVASVSSDAVVRRVLAFIKFSIPSPREESRENLCHTSRMEKDLMPIKMATAVAQLSSQVA